MSRRTIAIEPVFVVTRVPRVAEHWVPPASTWNEASLAPVQGNIAQEPGAFLVLDASGVPPFISE